jgi:hypothetical protein
MKIILMFIGVLGGIYLSYEYPEIALKIWNFAWDWFVMGFNWIQEKISAL